MPATGGRHDRLPDLRRRPVHQLRFLPSLSRDRCKEDRRRPWSTARSKARGTTQGTGSGSATSISYDRHRQRAAKELGIRTETLDREVEKRRRQPSTKKPSDDGKEFAKFERAAGDLIREPDILSRFGETVQACGLIGETGNAKILYLAHTSRLFERPVSVAVKGISAGGKSFTVETVLRFLPPEAFFARTGMSEHALVYSAEDFQHRHILIFEHAGMESEKLSYFIRTLLSENRVSYETVEKNDEGLRARLIEKLGPTGIITTTTAATLHPENETRLLSLGVIDSPTQTAAVMKALGSRAASGDSPGGDLAEWQAFQGWLALGERRVVIPFAPAIADRIPPVAVRLRRDISTLLALIGAHALLHRSTRPADQHGRIMATLADYVAVYDLVAKLFAEGIEATVPPTVRETVEAVEAMGQPEVSHSRTWPSNCTLRKARPAPASKGLSCAAS
jgi:predicted fused transcriptional regulator/phosphomethylpyrimidine kinase